MGEPPKRVTVPCRVHPDTKDQWHDFVEQSDEWDSVSDLIRGAVHREMDGWYSANQSSGTVDTTELEQTVEELVGEIDELKEKVTDQINLESAEESELVEIIRDKIPSVESISELNADMRNKTTGVYGDRGMAAEEYKAQKLGYVDRIAKQIAVHSWADRRRIEDIMYKMGDEMSSIVVIEGPDGHDRIAEVKDGL